MRNLSNWRSVRLWESGIERELRQSHPLWLHGGCIGLLVVGAMWAAAHLQMMMGSDSLALRYAITLGVGYLAYLGVLRIWAAALVGRGEPSIDVSGDLPLPDLGGVSVRMPEPAMPQFSAGGGGDFGGGGATADFSDAAGAGIDVSDVASGALEAAAGADEGAVVVIPVVVVFLIGMAVLFGAGSLLMLYFGSEALLAVAVEVAFGYVSARTAVSVVREGWLSAVLRLTWKPLLGALFCAVALGALIDQFIPQAHSLPQAVKVIKASR
jgi:hypothetical protein